MATKSAPNIPKLPTVWFAYTKRQDTKKWFCEVLLFLRKGLLPCTRPFPTGALSGLQRLKVRAATVAINSTPCFRDSKLTLVNPELQIAIKAIKAQIIPRHWLLTSLTSLSFHAYFTVYVFFGALQSHVSRYCFHGFPLDFMICLWQID